LIVIEGGHLITGKNMRFLFRDIVVALRILQNKPTFSLLVILALGLALGANTIIFSFVDAILLRPFPVSHPAELVKLGLCTPQGELEGLSYSEFLDFASQSRSLSGLLAYGMRGGIVKLDGPPILTTVAVVSPSYFSLLGIKAQTGRLFGAETEKPEQALVAVFSHKFWLKHFGGDPQIAGRNIRLDNRLCMVAGIATPEFQGLVKGEPPDLWIPVNAWIQLEGEKQVDRDNRWFSILGRLAPGVKLSQTLEEARVIQTRWETAYPALYEKLRLSAQSHSANNDKNAWSVGVILLLLSGLLLMVACVNIANLLLAHQNSRRKEISIRRALGASQPQIFRLLLSESVVLTIGGAIFALLIAGWLITLLPALFAALPFASQWDFRMDLRVAGYTLLISLLAIFGFGTLPSLQTARQNLNETLRNTAANLSNPLRTRSFPALLVVSQLALTTVLLVAAGLLTRTFLQVQRIDPGFKKENRLLVWMLPAVLGYKSELQYILFYRTLLDQARALPGVLEATLVQRPPLYPIEGGQTQPVQFPDRKGNAGKPPQIRFTIVWSNYFQSMGIPILRGRTFTGMEPPAGPATVLINESMAHQYWANQNPVGMHILAGPGPGRDCEIIGVVRDGKYVNLKEEAAPYLYFPATQFILSGDMTLMIRTAADPHALSASVQRVLQQLAPELPKPEISTLEELLQQDYSAERVIALLVSILGGLAFFLALAGLYGLLSYTVRQRTREIGIRISLGAHRKSILIMVLRQSLVLIMIGTAMGLFAALAGMRYLSSQLYGIPAYDLLTFGGVAILLILVSLAACLIPARRAASVDPMVALRYE
jgi:predicted permease